MRLFSSKGLIYISAHRATQHVLRKTPPSLLLERLAHNKLHKWQNSFLSLSFPLSSPLFSLPHPSHFQRRRAVERAPTCEPWMNEFWLTHYLSSRCLAPAVTSVRANPVTRSLDCEEDESGKVQTQEGLTLEPESWVFFAKWEYKQLKPNRWGWRQYKKLSTAQGGQLRTRRFGLA